MTERVRLRVAEARVLSERAMRGGVDEVRIPGERAYRERARLAREGIEIDRRIQDALIRLAESARREG